MNMTAGFIVCFIPLAAASLFLVLRIRELTGKVVLAAVLLGLAAVIPAAFAQFGLGQVISAYFHGTGAAVLLLFSNGLIEETIRTVFLSFLPAKKQPLRAFTAATAIAGLSLGSFEAVVYLIAGSRSIGLRMITAVILHCACSCMCGLFVRGHKCGQKNPSIFVWAVTIHAVYNFFASFSNFVWYFSLVAILFSIIQCRIFYKYAEQMQFPVDTSAPQ